GVKFPQSTIYSQNLTIDAKQFGTGEVIAFSYSPPTPKQGITANLVLIPDGSANTTGAGCDATDYDGLNVTGKIAFISRGTCTFAIKSTLARNAGAVAAIIYNNVANQGAISSRISYNTSESVPTVFIGLETAQPFISRLNGTTSEIVPATVKVDSLVKDVVSENIIAQTFWGNQSNVIHVGGHLDSVPAGPGVNDDGSGSATVAELLVQLAKFKPSRNAVRFSWWTNEGEHNSGQ
ncbi:Leucyl aminopeptidase yscIV, partial [Ceratobasidium sp. 428]